MWSGIYEVLGWMFVTQGVSLGSWADHPGWSYCWIQFQNWSKGHLLSHLSGSHQTSVPSICLTGIINPYHSTWCLHGIWSPQQRKTERVQAGSCFMLSCHWNILFVKMKFSSHSSSFSFSFFFLFFKNCRVYVKIYYQHILKYTINNMLYTKYPNFIHPWWQKLCI